jgi:dienelactone hydrolase
LTLSEIRFRLVDADIYGLLAAPPQPKAAVVLVPGAGVTKEGHAGRAKAYALQGYAVLVLDARGHGGRTAGYPMNVEEDYGRFQAGTWPQTYAIAADIVGCRMFLTERYHVPVYALGESNGGRYAIIAAAADPGFAGVAGVSTSGFGLAGMDYEGDAARFLLSIDPDHAVPALAGRSIWIAHSKADSIIPYEDGVALFDRAGEPKHFIESHGGHGINEEVDRILLEAWSRSAGAPQI